MIHKWMEQWFDTILFLVMLVGMLLFFWYFWQNELQIRYAEAMAEDFLTEVSVRGKISRENMEGLVKNIGKVNPDYGIVLEGTKYVTEPVYAKIPREYLSKYFAERNNIKSVTFPKYQLLIPEESAEELRLQKETNATILSSKNKEYLPLPQEGMIWKAEAVYPVQEVYEKEPLITLCRLTSEEGVYYAEAEQILAEYSGVVYLCLQLGEEKLQIPVEVSCYPRTINCRYGHEVVNTESVRKEYLLNHEVSCPYCQALPKQMLTETPIVYKKCGSGLNGTDISLLVEYMDAHTEIITPEFNGWQDSYDENYCGIQQVEIRYRGISLYITVVSENGKCEQCGGGCNDRCYTDYLRFPYCLNCLKDQDVFICEFYEAEQHISQKELYIDLEQKQETCFMAGDFVTLRLMKRGKVLSLLQQKIRCNGEENTK